MRIAIIGSGMIGSTAARLFVGAGHEVAIANRRGPHSLASLAAELGPDLRPATVDEAVAFGEVTLVAVPLGAIASLPAAAFNGKIVVDANNYYPGRDGNIAALDSDETTSTELLAAHLREARMVKAFNTMRHSVLASQGNASKPLGERLALYVAGDDAEAKAIVSGLIEELGFAAVDTGGLAVGGRLQQPGSPVYAADLTAAQARPHLS